MRIWELRKLPTVFEQNILTPPPSVGQQGRQGYDAGSISVYRYRRPGGGGVPLELLEHGYPIAPAGWAAAEGQVEARLPPAPPDLRARTQLD